MAKQLKSSALIVAVAASTTAFVNGVVPGADWTGEPSGKYYGYTTNSNPLTDTGEIVVAGSDSVDDTPECWKNGFNEDANPTLGNNCAHPYAEQASV